MDTKLHWGTLGICLAVVGTAGCPRLADTFTHSQAAARDLALGERVEIWRAPTDARGADLIAFLGASRVLVGEMEGGGVYSSPRHGALKLLDAASGRVLWTAKRDGLAKGTYDLVATSPAIVLLGTDKDEATLVGYDPATGARRWRTTVAGQVSTTRLSVSNHPVLLLLAERGRRATLQRLDLATGGTRWSQKVSAGGGPPLAVGDLVCLGGDALRCYDAARGQPRFTVAPPALGGPLQLAALRPAPGGAPPALVVYSARGIALVDARDGAQRWVVPSPPGTGTKLVATRGDLVLALAGDGGLLGTDGLRAISATDGSIRWAVDTDGTVVSALYTTADLALFTIEDQLVALRLDTGAPAFRAPLGGAFGPSNPVATGGPPDGLRVTPERVVVDRDGVGLQAFSLPGGGSAWSAPTPGRPSVAVQYRTLLSGLKIRASAQPPMVRYAAPAPSPVRRLTQEQVDRMSYLQLKTHIAGERIMAKAQFAVSVANAVGSLAQLITVALEQAFWSGLVARARVAVTDAVRARGQGFHGPVHVHWFEDLRGAGVRLVRLSDGQVTDQRVGPRDGVHRLLSAGAATVALSPSGRQLVVVHLGLRADQYRPASSSGARGVQAAILSFDLATPKPQRPAVPFQPVPGIANLAHAVLINRADAARHFLAAGADPNQIVVKTTTFTALRFAVIKRSEAIVRLLLKHGAKPTQLHIPGPTALDYAHTAGVPAIITILEAAGARRRPVATPPPLAPGARPAYGKPRPLPPLHTKLYAAIASGRLYLARRALRQGDNGWRQAPVLVAALTADRPALARELLRRGADVNAPSEYGHTALHLATVKNDQALMRELLRRKADPNARNVLGETPLMLALGGPAGGAIYLPQMTARARILLEAGADPNQRYLAPPTGTPSITLLELAAKKGHGLAKLFRRHGAR